MNELAKFNYNLQTQTPKTLHEQQCGIYGFHFLPPHSMRAHGRKHPPALLQAHTHTNTITGTFAQLCSSHTHSPMASLAICVAFSFR